MSWKQKSISLCRRAMSGQLFQKSSLKPSLNFGARVEAAKIRQQSSDCVQSKKSLFDEAPVPQGSWSENFKRKDAKQTRVLVLGLVSFLATVALIQKRGFAKGHPEISLFF